MTWSFVQSLQNSRIFSRLALAALAVLAAVGLVARERRDAAKDAMAKRDAKDAQANEEAHARINEADTGAGLSDDARRDRLRQFAARHKRDGSPKAGGR